MFVTSITALVVLLKTTTGGAVPAEFSPWTEIETFNTTSLKGCQYFGEIENGVVEIDNDDNWNQVATIECEEGYDLDGAPKIYCINGNWDPVPRPQCTKRCHPPPYIKNGSLEIDGGKDEKGLFHKGTLATYSCSEGFALTPKESQYRVCEKGIWTGAYATCEAITNCSAPKDIHNGYFVPEKSGEFDGYRVGQRLHYSCKSGYILVGPPVQQCLDDGTWSPKLPPVCSLAIAEDPSDYPCPASPTVPHSYTTLVKGYQSENLAISGTVVQIHCFSKHRNIKAPCQPGKLQCMGGKWVGTTPECVPAHDCDPPPAVAYAVIYNLNPEVHDISFSTKYPIKSQISYQCLPGYTLQGSEILACSSAGCWSPGEPPTCYRTSSNNYFMNEVNNISAVLISGATGAGVLGVLLVICLITICRRRKPLSRAVPIAPPVPRSDLGDHATLLHHPDRLALIAFADGMQNDQGSLPTYDEATRDRTPNLMSNRLHRPHWPNLGGRRSRNTANPADMVHVTRHGSFASHTPSTRSAGDSMGSTDTVAVSEGSTNVTLDTASSYSGSQPASCRVHCGSLASFDTSSVVNTEGVPLLEENELEESLGGDTVSLVVDNPSISDNASFKLSTNSADLS